MSVKRNEHPSKGQLGNSPGGFSLDLKYTQEEGVIYLTGIQSLVRLTLDQHRADRRRGLRTAIFVSGYPGSPLAGLDLELNRQKRILEEHDTLFIPGLNEELAATAVFGSQMMHSLPRPKYDGVVGMWFGKNPGVDRSGDALRHANFRGVGKNGGVLALTGDDSRPRSSTLSTDANTTFYDFFMPVIYPGNVQEVLDLGIHGFMLSRASGLWVGMKILSEVADSAGTAEVSPDRIAPVVPSTELDGRLFEPQLHLNTFIPEILDVERGLYLARLELAKQYARENGINRIVLPTSDAWLGIVAAGKTYFDVRQALSELGLDDAALERYGIRILKMGMLFPVEPHIIREFARGLEEILVIEDKRPFLESFVKEILYNASERPTVVGKMDEQGREFLPMHGGLDVDLVARAIASRLRRKASIESVDRRIRELDAPRPVPISLSLTRRAYYCSGCPHNRSLVVPEQTEPVGAGIGCHFMALFGDRQEFGQVLGYTQMGGEGAQWIGLAPFTETPHLFQNLGDGTFFHSGSLAVRFAVAAGANITYKILYNQAVAMTGGQSVTGGRSIPELTDLLQAEGVAKIIVTTDDPSKYRRVRLAKGTELWHRDRLLEAQRRLSGTPGVTVLIHDQQCAAEKRRLRRRGKLEEPATRVYINQRICEGCGDCGKKSNCLSVQPIQTEFGSKTQIHQSSCNKDYSCLLGDCPAFVTVTVRETAGSGDGYPSMDVHLPEPVLKVPANEFSMYTMGIGGTGVVTVNQILGTAAFLDGKRVLALDDLGFSQKAGPVMSHLKVFTEDRPTTNMVMTAGTDLYLVFDLLTGVGPDSLGKADPSRTVAVVSTSEVPTGRMIVDTGAQFPESTDLLGGIERVTRKDDNLYLDAQDLSEALFGDHMPANIMLVGAAYQQGAIPISARAIEEAIRVNGVEVEKNLAAFRWGRAAVADPELVERALKRARGVQEPPTVSAPARELLDSTGATGELRRLLEVRVPDLIAYQDVRYAARYVEFVRKVKGLEEEKSPAHTEITEAVARHLYGLMAYKDEYEVARLYLRRQFRDELKAKFGDDIKVTWHLDPPLLRALGLKKKMRLGGWFGPVFRLLRMMRHLRGTPFDLFGYTRVRRMERELVDRYRRMMETALLNLTEGKRETVLALANLPDEIRGYEDIKLRSVERYWERATECLSTLGVAPDQREPARTRS